LPERPRQRRPVRAEDTHAGRGAADDAGLDGRGAGQLREAEEIRSRRSGVGDDGGSGAAILFLFGGSC
jgi:hypothetical protein